jgi:hypothetical protein
MQWGGVVHTAAIFDRSFMRADLKTPSVMMKRFSSITRYDFDQPHALAVRSSGTDGDSLSVPARFTPYHRITLLDTFRFMGKQRPYIPDIVANIFFFLPVGFFSALVFLRKFKNILPVIAVSVAIGLALSVCVEVLQIFLPSRYSSMFDVLSNTAGTALGALGGIGSALRLRAMR